MNTNGRFQMGVTARRVGLTAAAALLVVGATWRGLAAGQHAGAAKAGSSIEQAATTQAPVSRSIVGGRDSYSDIVKAVAPAVVTIRTEGKARMSPTGFDSDGDNEDLFRRFFGEPFEGQRRSPRSFTQRALGSGVIVSGDGYILTNNHVVENADDIRVEVTDGRTLKAKVVGTDKPSDLALLKIDASNLQSMPLGNSDAVQVGDVVLAVGNPLGIGQTVTMGIISAKGRQTEAGDSYQDFLQTDAPINQGNSGGALVSTKGELIGINSQIASVSDGNIGIGFAIPANMAKRVMYDLKSGGRVHRAQLGVVIQPVTSEMAESLGLKQAGGAIVSSVTPGSAAERAGMKRGDVIVSFNGEPVHDPNTLRNHVAEAGPGSTASVVVQRGGSERTLHVKLDEANSSKSASSESSADHDDKAALGISAVPLTPDLAARAGVARDTKGVFVQDMNPSGRAANAGIQSGDIIEEVNQQSVQNVDELRAAVKKSAERPALILVNRQGRELFVTVRPS